MRALLMALVLAFTYSMAGMYQSTPLAVLSGAELAALVVMSVLPCCFRRTVRLSFTERLTEAVRGSDALCRMTARNTGLLPAGYIELRLSIHTPGERRSLRRRLYGGAERGETQMAFRLRTPYCALVRLRLEQVRYYDYLNLFALSRRSEEELRIAVFPPEQSLRVDLSGGGGAAGIPRNASPLPGEGSDEIRKLREYQAGDPIRRVHWNLSARTDTLWIKEFERDADAQVLLLPDGVPGTLAGADAFYRLLSALLYGFLTIPASVQVRWKHGGRPYRMEVTEGAQVRDLLLALYRSPPDAQADPVSGNGQTVLRLTTELALYADGQEIRRFSPETLDRVLTAEAAQV